MKRLILTSLLCASFAVLAQQPLLIPVTTLDSAPKVDGDIAEWGTSGWVKIPVVPALEKADRANYGLDPNDDRNQTGRIVVQAKAAVVGDRFYIALKYPDKTEDVVARPWEWRGEKYVEGRQRDDMFALRFHMSGDFDRSMLSSKDYKVDVWVWSAGRTNPSGTAEDMTHHVTTRMLESAAEYEGPDKKTIYIKKVRDAGNANYKVLPRPKEFKGDKVPSFEVTASSASAADVAAKGRWKSGYWQLEFSRAMNTGHPDDAAFKPGQKILGQLAVFDQGYAEHKSISEPLLFDFSAIK